LTVKNPTPFHITLTSIMQDQSGKRVDLISQGLMLKPFSDGTVNLKNSNVSKMTFTTINDYGGRIERNIKF
ncbi:MAG: molecular chaperone, partial [Acinetobacter sp.]|nr:molecular chaperone [Acinetobacter sp.]